MKHETLQLKLFIVSRRYYIHLLLTKAIVVETSCVSIDCFLLHQNTHKLVSINCLYVLDICLMFASLQVPPYRRHWQEWKEEDDNEREAVRD